MNDDGDSNFDRRIKGERRREGNLIERHRVVFGCGGRVEYQAVTGNLGQPSGGVAGRFLPVVVLILRSSGDDSSPAPGVNMHSRSNLK